METMATLVEHECARRQSDVRVALCGIDRPTDVDGPTLDRTARVPVHASGTNGLVAVSGWTTVSA